MNLHNLPSLWSNLVRRPHQESLRNTVEALTQNKMSVEQIREQITKLILINWKVLMVFTQELSKCGKFELMHSLKLIIFSVLQYQATVAPLLERIPG